MSDRWPPPGEADPQPRRAHPHGEQHEGPPPPDVPARPRSEPRSLQYHDLAGSRPIPAGKVLLIGVVALFLAALLNVDGLYELANRQPVGWKRDVAKGVVSPFCAVSRVTKLREARAAIREAADKRVQSCDESSAGSDAFVAPDTATTTTLPGQTTAPPTTQRQPTAEEPLRVWLGGDSMTIELADSVESAVTGRGELALTTHPQVSSGLTRPDYYDWPAYFADEVLPTNPEVMVVMFGANDSQGMEIEGTPYQPSSPEWQAEYRRRVGVVMDQLKGDGRLVIWVGQPRMREEGFDARMGVLDDIFAAEAETRPWVHFLDSRPVLSPDGDGYQSESGGTSLRQGDGIHLDRAGADLLADAVLAVIDQGGEG